MLVAIDTQDKKKIAFETEKHEAPFFCPECHCEVILKKGNIKEHHYAHKPPFDCKYGSGESELHYKVKHELYSLLSAHPKCSKCELERPLRGVRPDVSLYIGDKPVIIEVQRSDIDIETIMRRTLRYTELGCYILWVNPNNGINTFSHLIKDELGGEYEEMVYRPKQWEIYLHAMYFGRLYFYQGYASFLPVHLEKIEQYVPISEWYDGNGEEISAGGYVRTLKTIKSPLEGEISHLVDNFRKIKRDSWDAKNWSIPKSNLWIDAQQKWW